MMGYEASFDKKDGTEVAYFSSWNILDVVTAIKYYISEKSDSNDKYKVENYTVKGFDDNTIFCKYIAPASFYKRLYSDLSRSKTLKKLEVMDNEYEMDELYYGVDITEPDIYKFNDMKPDIASSLYKVELDKYEEKMSKKEEYLKKVNTDLLNALTDTDLDSIINEIIDQIPEYISHIMYELSLFTSLKDDEEIILNDSY